MNDADLAGTCPHFKVVWDTKPYSKELIGYTLCRIWDEPCPMITNFLAYYGRAKR